MKNTPTALRFTDETIQVVYQISGGYPYFVQFICHELYDVVIRGMQSNTVPDVGRIFATVTQKLDIDFFAGRWAKTTDRQRDFLLSIVRIEGCEQEFTIQQVVEASQQQLTKGFSSGHASQLLQALSDAGLVYKNRRGKYAFAVPMLYDFIRRQAAESP